MGESIQKLTHIEHVLKRPDSYVGPVDISSESYWILNKARNKFEKKSINYSPALLKIFDEILVNAIDRNSVHPKSVTSISARIDKETGAVTIENNGPLGGIGVRMHEKEGLWNPELTFGHLLTSTNYDDTKKRVVGGRNGYGAKLTNIYSSEFSIIIKDHETKQTYSQKWENNMTVCHQPKITKHSGSTSSVSITFIPDWKRFGMKRWMPQFTRSLKSVFGMQISAQLQVVKSNSKETFFPKHHLKHTPRCMRVSMNCVHLQVIDGPCVLDLPKMASNKCPL
jgi:DNA topoisomerase-2